METVEPSNGAKKHTPAARAKPLDVVEDVRRLPLASLRPTPNNRDCGDLKDLAASIAQVGIVEPLVVRPLPDEDGQEVYELVVGNRRARAAASVGETDVPCIVRVLSDQQAAEMSLIENIQRADIHPMEEAVAFERLSKEHRLTAEEIAAKVGKAVAYVYGRMKLTALCPKARSMFLADKLTAALALLVARIPDAKMQAEAAERIATGRYPGAEPMSLREATEYVQREHMQALSSASFNVADAHLVAGAGACSVCPKRTGNQAALFSDVKGKDVCTDVACFKSKQDADWVERTKIAARDGQRVLTDKETKKIFPYRSDRVADGTGLVALDERCYSDPKGRTFGQIAGKKLELDITIARDPEGRVRELVKKTDLTAAIKDSGKKVPAQLAARPVSSMSEQEKKRQRERKIEKEVTRRAIAKLVAFGEKTGPTKATQLALARALIQESWRELALSICARRAVDVPTKGGASDGRAALVKHAETLELNALHALTAELIMGKLGQGYAGTSETSATALAYEAFKVDTKKIGAEVRAELAEAAKKKPAPGAKKKVAKRKA